MHLVSIIIGTNESSWDQGGRILEIGAIAIHHNRLDLEHVFHQCFDLQDGEPSDLSMTKEDAVSSAWQRFLDFIEGSALIFFDSESDLAFINQTLDGAGLPSIKDVPKVDILAMAQERFRKPDFDLENLCDFLWINRKKSQPYNILDDAECLAEIYLQLSGHADYDLSLSKRRFPPHSVSDMIPMIYRQVEDRFQAKFEAPLPTGVTQLDDTCGGIFRGDVVLIAGDMTEAAAVGMITPLAFRDTHPCSVTIFSPHQSAANWTRLMLAHISDVSVDDLESGQVNHEQWRRLARAVGQLGESDIQVYDGALTSIDEIRDICRYFKRDGIRRDIFLIDNLQCILGKGDEEQEQKKVYQKLKSIASHFEAVIILLIEPPLFSRMRKNAKGVSCFDLLKFYFLAENADIIFFSSQKYDGKLTITLAKSRRGSYTRL